MKYKNSTAKPPARGEMLPFVQQFLIMVDLIKELLYLVQDFKSV
ncbi:hypothetical protein [Paenibacillus phytohabitans]